MLDAAKVEIQFDYNSPQSKDILRCLMTLYTTREGSQPLDRNFGLNWDFIDKPLPVAQQEYAYEVIKKTKEYETRAKVKEVKYQYEEESGKMKPIVVLIKGGAE